MIRVDSFVVDTLRNDSYASICRSFLNVNQSLQFCFQYKYNEGQVNLCHCYAQTRLK